MEKVYYKTEWQNSVLVSTTPCHRRKVHDRNIGSRACMGCSYCYDKNEQQQYVLCRKQLTPNQTK